MHHEGLSVSFCHLRFPISTSEATSETRVAELRPDWSDSRTCESLWLLDNSLRGDSAGSHSARNVVPRSATVRDRAVAMPFLSLVRSLEGLVLVLLYRYNGLSRCDCYRLPLPVCLMNCTLVGPNRLVLD